MCSAHFFKRKQIFVNEKYDASPSYWSQPRLSFVAMREGKCGPFPSRYQSRSHSGVLLRKIEADRILEFWNSWARAVLHWSVLWFICSPLEDLLFVFIYVFMWPCQVSAVVCGSCSCGIQDLLVVAGRVFNCGTRTLSCGVWALVPWPGIKSGSPALGAWSLSPWDTSEVPGRFGLYKIVLFCGRKVFAEQTYNLVS